MKFRFEENDYDTEDEIIKAVTESHPELLDDDIPDFIDNNVEYIIMFK